MSGTFSSLNTALSGLRYQQIALDVAGTNVANATTEGYVRRRVAGETLAPGVTPALWSRSQDYGNGVRATGITRLVDPFLDARSRVEHGNQSYLDTQAAVLARVETGFAEPGDNGVSAAVTDFRKSLHDLVNAPGSEAARSQVLGKAGTVADAIRLQAHNVSTEIADQRGRLGVTLTEVNTVAADLADTNRSLASAKLAGSDATTLADTRDRLALRLSELTGATATVRDDGGMDVALNGVSLVSGQSAGTVSASVGSPTNFTIGPAGTTVPGTLGGIVGAVAELVDHTLPDYAAGLDAIAKDFADALNTQHAAGYDLAGNAGGPLFSYDPADPAGSLQVAVTDPALVAASSVPGGGLDAGNADDLIGAIAVEDPYQRLVNGFGTQVASVRRRADNQQALTNQVDNSREQLAGVNLDEETVNMLTAQRSYEAAARLMTTLDSVLDTLVNRTGMTR
ncbi:flagellar hook-associated protein FlgK [Nocardioides sp. LS1]|uniref:flagellar hook-associated protein FlgK n=1 Tax=Nocardioides sp. LS1 TaxID=1027620 RepID=UPI000F61EED7|nr:flagellar hook-associated protein FlgK [Nocardioides sp. LS1]GCD89527.1 flagellar hook-associated protein 1 [Nocardioides sp. LS1]